MQPRAHSFAQPCTLRREETDSTREHFDLKRRARARVLPAACLTHNVTTPLAPLHRVRPFNLGLHFFASKVAFSCSSVDRFGKKCWGLMILCQVKSVPNFC